MDKYTGKRAVGGIGISARGSGLTSRDTSHNENRSGQCCNRLGCSTRHNSMKGTQIGNSEKDNKPSLSVRSRSSNSMVGSSSKTYSAMNEVKKPNPETQKPSFHKVTISTETSKTQMEKEVSDPSPSNPKAKDASSGVFSGLSVDTSEEVGTSSEAPNTRIVKAAHKRAALVNQDSPNPSSRRSFAPRNASQISKPISHAQGNSNRHGLRNLGCSSVSDVLPGCSSSDSSRSRRIEVAKRKSSEAGSRGKFMSGSSSGGNSGNQRNPPSSSSLTLSERPSSQQSSRRTRNWPPTRDGVTSVRTRRTINGETRARLSEDGDGNNLLESDPSVEITELSYTEALVGQTSETGSSQQSPLVLPTAHRSSYERPGSSNGSARSRAMSHSEDDGLRLFNGLSIDRDGFRRFNMDGIAEVLLALDRIEHDEELTYEQLLALEANLFLGGISFHDQHRDMRLDIDNMSYEELLALEEKMGNVSTALTEEAITKCLKRSCYMPAPMDGRGADCGDDDVKCSICQEEYVEGEEVGKLWCDHRYHMVCVQQWLQQKNWCPICKAPAAAS